MSFLESVHYQISQVGNEQSSSCRFLVFLHGLMGYGANWKRVIYHLKGDWTVLTFDQRGHGHSFKPETGYEPEDYAEDLRQILDELGWRKIFLVGHSMGGRNGLHFAHKYPGMVERLVIEDIGPDNRQENVSHIKKLLSGVPTPFKSKAEARHFLKSHFVENQALGSYLYSNMVKVDSGLVDWCFSKSSILESVQMGRKTERWGELKELRLPTLVLRGEHSKELPQEVFQRMLSSNPDWLQGYLFSGVGHWIHSEKTQEFTRVVEGFLQGESVGNV